MKDKNYFVLPTLYAIRFYSQILITACKLHCYNRSASNCYLLVTGHYSGTPRRLSESVDKKSASRPESPKSVRSVSSSASNHSNYSNQPRSTSNHSNQPRAEELLVYRKSSNGKHTPVPHPPEPPNSSREKVPNSSRESVSSTNISVGYEGDRIKSPGKGMKGNSLTDSRKRIAQAVGRR